MAYKKIAEALAAWRDVVDGRAAPATLSEVARRHGVWGGSLHKAAVRAGLPTQVTGAVETRGRKRSHGLAGAQRDWLRVINGELLGETLSAIAARHGLQVSTLSKSLHRDGIPGPASLRQSRMTGGDVAGA